jgi:hypothetical protein
VSSNLAAEKRFSKQSFAEDKEMMMSGVSYRGMHISFFDEKKLAVWKYQMESIFFTIGCLGITRGDAKKKRTKQFGVISAYVWRLCLEGLCSRGRWEEWEHTWCMVIDAWEDDDEEAS